MGLFSRIGLKSKFSPKGKKPTVQDFADLIDSQLNVTDDNHRIGLKEHNESTVYLTGDTCLYESKLYKALEQTSGEFNSEKWANIDFSMWEIQGEGLIKPKNSNKIDAAYIDNIPDPTDKYGCYINSDNFYIALMPVDSNVTNLYWGSKNIIKIPDLSGGENIISIDIASNNINTVFLPATLTQLNILNAVFSGIINVTLALNLTMLADVNFADNYLSQTSVDQILLALDTAGAESGQLRLEGVNNAPPTGGLDNPNLINLVNKFWTIYT